MSIDLEKLLLEISPEAPAGANLEYDPGFAELEQAARGKPEQQMGSTIIPAEEPNWRDVVAKATELLLRSKDLRVAVHLAGASLRTAGLGGFRDGLTLVRGLVDTFWDTLYPQLDPDDDNDPTMRVNALAPLTDANGLLRVLRETPLVESRAVGRFAYRDFQQATGALPVPKGKKAPELASLDAAFGEAPLDAVQATEQALAQAMEQVRALEGVLTDRVGSEQTADLRPLYDLLRHLRQVVLDRLKPRLDLLQPDPPEADVSDETAQGDAPAADTPRAAAVSAPGEIRNRDDVDKTLQRLCDYYERFEPSSPLPLLLHRAKRLVKLSFLDIIKDLAPDAVSQVERIRGVDTDSK